ncbi:hypothetical protein ACIRRT_29575 [Streptomyces sp. NPDC102256]
MTYFVISLVTAVVIVARNTVVLGCRDRRTMAYRCRLPHELE